MTNEQKERLKLLGSRVKNIRNQKNLTLKEVAHKINKDPQSVHRLETGGVNPSYLYLVELCEGLDIDINELLKS